MLVHLGGISILNKGHNSSNIFRIPTKSGHEVIKLFSYSTQLSTKLILLINVKMQIIVGILIFISMILNSAVIVRNLSYSTHDKYNI